MPAKKLLVAGAIVAAVATGSVAGALIGAPNTSSAQESPSTTAPAAPDPGPGSGPDAGPGWGFGGPGGPGDQRGHHAAGAIVALDTAADTIGVSVEDLRSAIRDGQSIAEVATANGVDVQTVVDALVAEATTHIDDAVTDGRLDADRADEIKADLPDRITEAVNHEGPLGPPRDGHGPGFRGPGLDTAAETIGISVDDLRSALDDGQSIAEVAQAHDVDPQDVIDALVAQATQDLTEHITDFVNG